MASKAEKALEDHVGQPEDAPAVEQGLNHAITQGETVLELLGLESPMKKSMGVMALICTGYNICNSWVGMAATLAVGIEQGGSVSVLYGMIIILVLLGASAATMAELASVYPTAGGPYHWTSILAPKGVSRVMSYICASLNIFGWLSICSSVTIQPGQFIEAIRIYYDPDVAAPTWQYFLFYQATNLVFLLHNVFFQRGRGWIHDVGFFVSLASFVVIFASCLGLAPSFRSTEAVWTQFDNASGWSSSGVVFLTALANPNFLFAGIDGVAHLAEEASSANKAVPLTLLSTIVIGFVTAFPFVIAMLYTVNDFHSVIESATGVPIFEIWVQATHSGVASSVVMILLLLIACFALNACIEVSSRLTWAFARDNALIGSMKLSKVHDGLQVPIWALCANSAIIFIIGCIYLGSSAAFNAFVGSGMLLQQCCFAMPAALLLWHRRSPDVLPPTRYVKLGVFGWVSNVLTVAFAPITVIFYCFPVELPVTPSNMNYTSAVIGVMAIFSVLNWFLHARKNYRGPRLPDMSVE